MMTFDDVTARYPDQFAPSFKPECGQGWAQIVGRLLDDIAHLAEESGFRILGAHEKMGALRLTTAFPARYEDGFRPSLLLAEFRSRVTCDECGRAGHMRTLDGWKHCRCDDHCTDEERAQPARPAWTLGRLTSEGYLWFDQATDTLQSVSLDDLEKIGMPADMADRMKAEAERLPL